MRSITIGLMFFAMTMSAATAAADEFALQLRSIRDINADTLKPAYDVREQSWSAEKTAVIVCDVWDLHHCLNAVRRLEEFAPRLDAVLKEARRRGATIIHSPSDCMAAYETHPARLRAMAVPKADPLPRDIAHWCSQIPLEKQAVYPIDQSDGGEDDDPTEHAAWVAKLTAMGRKPGTPWLMQSPLITIDGERDYISDKGDEVWSILKARGVEHVILTGVHTNMCVLGRPFGLRQMVRNGMPVVLMRDMTDCMYNPKRWPYVDHFTGNDLVIAHVEQFVCPTITSDQVLGGRPFQSKFDARPGEFPIAPRPQSPSDVDTFAKQWTTIELPGRWNSATRGAVSNHEGVAWHRCVVRTPSKWIRNDGLQLVLPAGTPRAEAWFNGHALTAATADGGTTFRIERDWIERDDA
ncbi:MAG TPA: hypothetical protein VM165_09615, partial [Planctomycetaceae bacterium]|nr:hypothetical protein [Planctomycetaceae bacterium]